MFKRKEKTVTQVSHLAIESSKLHDWSRHTTDTSTAGLEQACVTVKAELNAIFKHPW